MTKKLTILFDANPLATQKKSGIGYYTYQLVASLAHHYPEEVELVGHYFNFLGRRDMNNMPQAPNISYRKSVIWPGKVLNVGRRLGFVYVLRDQYVVQNVVFHADEQTVLDDPNELRIKLYEKGIDGIIAEPLGNGPGTAGLVSTRLSNGLLTENYYLQIAYEVGVGGFMLFAAFVAGLLWALWRRRATTMPKVLLASFVGLAFVNLLLHGWANEAVATAWFMLAGLTLTESQTK